MNTPSRAVVAPTQPLRLCAFRAVALLGACALAGGLVACGGGSRQSAQSLLNETFHSHKSIESGRIDLSLALNAAGSSTLKGPFSLRLQGPFQSAGVGRSSIGRLPRFALQFSLTTAGHTLQAGVTSTGSQFFVELEGTPFVAPESTVQALQQGYAEASRTASSSKSRSTFASLGIDPGEWLTNPTIAGDEKVGGADTVHLIAALNLARFMADANKLSGAGGALGLGGSTAGSGLGSGSFSATQVAALAGSVRSARVDVYTGADDHLLRRLSLSAAVSTTPQARATLGGLRSATLTLALQFADLNRPQKIVAPSNPRPISQLVGVLQTLGLVSKAQPSR